VSGHPLTESDLEAELIGLVSAARASGVAQRAIVDLLRRELEFNAEIGHSGHRYLVQLIDLGNFEEGSQTERRPERLETIYGNGYSG
jgi:hypothetical protein